MAVYAASKAFVLNFTEALWAEFKDDRSIRIVTVCPGGTATNFQRASGVKEVEGEKLATAEDVAKAINRAIRHGSGTIILGRRARLMQLLSRVLGRKSSVLLWKRLMGELR